MIAKLTYALVLFVHPDPEPRMYATFTTAEACRSERAAVAQDLGSAQITAVCVPQNEITVTEMSARMQQMMRIMQETMNNIERSDAAK